MGESAAKKKILIVDDEESFTKIVKMNLELTEQYEVRIENEGLRCLSAAREFKPDIIFLDLLMPDIDGSAVAYQLRSSDNTKNIPIVFLTAIVGKEEVETNRGIVGGHLFMAKPVSKEELIDCIEKNINKK